MERLGLGPDIALARNPRLIYGRMTGWGQTGPLAQAAGHDLAYIALTGALAAFGPARRTTAAAAQPRRRFRRRRAVSRARDRRGAVRARALRPRPSDRRRDRRRHRIADGAVLRHDGDGAADAGPRAQPARRRGAELPLLRMRRRPLRRGRAAGAEVLRGPARAARHRRAAGADWDAQARALADVFKRKRRDEWTALLEGTDACVAPVLALDEAPAHPHMRAARPIASSAVSCSPRPRRASRARRARWNARRPSAAKAAARRSRAGASATPEATNGNEAASA